MSKVVFLVAVASNGVIGYDGSMPWHYPQDISRFKQITMGYPIVMGRKTWESIPKKPLPGRNNIVLTRDKTFIDSRCEVYDDLKKAIYKYHNLDKIYVIGGAEIFKSYMEFADVLDITHIHKEYIGNVFFPEIDKDVWLKTSEVAGPELTFTTYEKRHIYKEHSIRL